MDFEKVLVSSNILSEENSYKCLYNVKLLRKMLPKTSSYVKSYDGKLKWTCF